MVDYARTRAVKEAVEARLLMYPGVHAVGIGPKITDGQRTDEPSIMVFLTQKRPLSELAPEGVVPAEIDGAKTDIIEMDVPRSYAAATGQNDLTDPTRPLVGGIVVQAGGALPSGTLGCFALTQEVQPRVVAITCHHVMVANWPTVKSSVQAAVTGGSPNPYVISFAIQGTVTSGSVVLILMAGSAPGALYKAWWTVTDTDTTADVIADHLKNKVNAITARSGITAAHGSAPGSIAITCPQGSAVGSCVVYDPVPARDGVNLTVSMNNNVISLSGRVDGDYCAYVSWNTDGGESSQGVFTLLPKGTPIPAAISAIVASIAECITAVGILGITPRPASSTITIDGAAQVSCDITGDPRVGQPNDHFSSDCSLCCAHEMGRVLDADLGTDAALVLVRRGMQYRNEVIHGGETSNCTNPSTAGNAVISGVHPITDEDAHAHRTVLKYGISTGFTVGEVIARQMFGINTDGPAPSQAQPNPPTSFHRYYRNALAIQAVGNCEFASGGDSGAPVYDALGNISGTVFGGGTSGGSNVVCATPIEQITARFKITIGTSAALNLPPQTVTDAQGAPEAVFSADNELLKRVLTTQSQISATPAGRRYAGLITRHAREVQDLVNHNRRVTVAWHRNSGPEILRAAVRFIARDEDRLPAEIGGMPLAERLARIGDALARNGSAELAADLARYGGGLIELTGLSYDEALERMRGSELADAE